MEKHSKWQTKCSNCGHYHWDRDPCILDDKLVVDTPFLSLAKDIKVVDTSGLVVDTESVVVDKSTGSRHGKYADLEKRKKYQREYKRKLRAKK